MKKLISLILALLMLAACGCGVAPEAQQEDEPIAGEELADIATTAAKEVREAPSDKGYVRGGRYADKTWRVMNAELGLDTNNTEVLVIKNNGSAAGDDFTRQIYLEFDLTNIAKLDYKSVSFVPSWTRTDTASVVRYNVYKVDPDSWNGDTLTWNNQPKLSNVIFRDALISGMDSVPLTDAVTEAIANGETKLSIALQITAKNANDCNMNPKNTYLVASTAAAPGTFVYQLVADEAENKAIWDYAQKVFNEWFNRYSEIRKIAKYDAELIVSDQDEFNKTVYSGNSGFTSTGWTLSNVNKAHKTRTYAALDDLGKYSNYDKVYPFDVYGGWMDPSMRQESTGFFYSTKINGRWWIIDPLGYPCYIRGLSSIAVNYLGSPNQKNAALEKYGTAEKFSIATVRWVKDELGFNLSGKDATIATVESRLLVQSSIGFAGAYGSKIGVNGSTGGSTVFTENNTMPIFDPGFVEFADTKAQEAIPNKDNEWIIGYTTDNELPMDSDMLYNYLRVDATKPANYYSYAAAWTWLRNMTGKENPSQADTDAELAELFMGFVWDRYYNVVTTAFRTYDPNHMMLGTRFLTAVRNHPWVLRFASLYLDCITINWYGQWTPDANSMYQIAQNVNLPIMITEFYTKAMENDGSFDDPSDPLKNTRGAGWIVRTQQDRGDFYQNFTLRLIECKNIVGWHWHQYLDDDDSPEVIYKGGAPDATGKNWKDQSNIDANKGVVNNWHEPYEELCASMAEINLNAYRLAQHFDGKYAK